MSKSLEELQELAERDGAAGDPSADSSTGATDGDDEPGPRSDADDSRALLGRTPFSAKGFLVTLAVLLTGLIAGSAVPLVGGLARYLGLFVAAFVLGLGRSRRAYLETAIAGALAAGGAFLLGTLTTGSLLIGTSLLADYGLPVAGVGVTVGVLLSVAGVYFGRDLRAGLTRDVE
ncbi:hypothetical protein [Halobaculum magnesiiphilum]|uniref:Uncharacterized protein n=1 Tax=Halobaculum magnesiiphilum TaxID=1017351 RepID=A0A8T8WCG4_9EURY|nr:hypothetical protein [Halobaculum magnesiiphilum]QZP37434.1 hypothetical protein K6T50_14335 [Halobaculum magnesiiphilum]